MTIIKNVRISEPAKSPALLPCLIWKINFFGSKCFKFSWMQKWLSNKFIVPKLRKCFFDLVYGLCANCPLRRNIGCRCISCISKSQQDSHGSTKKRHYLVVAEIQISAVSGLHRIRRFFRCVCGFFGGVCGHCSDFCGPILQSRCNRATTDKRKCKASNPKIGIRSGAISFDLLMLIGLALIWPISGTLLVWGVSKLFAGVYWIGYPATVVGAIVTFATPSALDMWCEFAKSKNERQKHAKRQNNNARKDV